MPQFHFRNYHCYGLFSTAMIEESFPFICEKERKKKSFSLCWSRYTHLMRFRIFNSGLEMSGIFCTASIILLIQSIASAEENPLTIAHNFAMLMLNTCSDIRFNFSICR